MTTAWLESFRSLSRQEQLARLKLLTPAQLKDLDRLLRPVKPLPWIPLPGPQTRAFHSRADELFLGGAAGGGKSDLVLGLSLTAHKHSLFLRRQAVQLVGAVRRVKEICGARGEWRGSGHGGTMTFEGRVLEMAGCDTEDSKDKYQGRPHSLKIFDELPHFSRGQYRFIIGWNRSTDPAERCRVVGTGNPPTTPEGRWIVEEWAPWLDSKFPDPAEPGDLRWYSVMDEEIHWFHSGESFLHKGERVTPRSRTFIPSRVTDNPYLMATGYVATLQALPEPLRSQMLYGDMSAGTEDDPWQVIPTAWVLAAQALWKPTPPSGEPMHCLGVDPARGGRDKTVLAARHGPWFAPLVKVAGKLTDDGPKVAALVLKEIRDDACVNIDVIGIGASAYDFLRANAAAGRQGPPKPGEFHGSGLVVNPVNNAGASDLRDRSGKFRLVNVRAASYWKLREALDPVHGDSLALPPDPELLADLCSAHYSVTAQGIQVEAKEDIVKRIGRSPDCGDSTVLAHWAAKRQLKIWT